MRARGHPAPSGFSHSAFDLLVRALLVCIPVLALGLAGCGSDRSAFSGRGSPVYPKSGPLPVGGGVYKVGTPYQIAGRWYYPKEDSDYDETGTASWYGPKFHRRMTSNGEWFDMERVSAAHPTLPLPSYARVTNLENGRSIMVRVNDRGPYAHDRIIDLSRRAAELLDFHGKGTAPVRVQYAGPAPLDGSDPVLMATNGETLNFADRQDRRVHTASAGPVPRSAQKRNARDITPARYGTEIASAPARRMQSAGLSPPQGGTYFIQAAAYANPDNALRARRTLETVGPVQIAEKQVAGTLFYRVRVGPYDDPGAAETARARIIGAGYRDARLTSH